MEIVANDVTIDIWWEEVLNIGVTVRWGGRGGVACVGMMWNQKNHEALHKSFFLRNKSAQ